VLPASMMLFKLLHPSEPRTRMIVRAIIIAVPGADLVSTLASDTVFRAWEFLRQAALPQLDGLTQSAAMKEWVHVQEGALRLPAWPSVHCASDRDWMVFLSPQGSSVARCLLLKTVARGAASGMPPSDQADLVNTLGRAVVSAVATALAAGELSWFVAAPPITQAGTWRVTHVPCTVPDDSRGLVGGVLMLECVGLTVAYASTPRTVLQFALHYPLASTEATTAPC
jgi:hypothetical protein